MLAQVAQVTRTYRTHILWHSENESWKRKIRPFRAYSSASPVVPFKSNAFDPLARFAAQRLSEIMETARQLKDLSESLLQEHDFTSAVPPQDPAEASSPDPIRRQLKELVAGYNQLYLASDNSYGTINGQAAKEALGELPYAALEPLGIRPDAAGLLQLEEAEEETPAAVSSEPLALEPVILHMASAVNEAAERMLTLSPDQLLNKGELPLQAFSKYRYQQWQNNRIHTYFPVPLTGFLLNYYL